MWWLLIHHEWYQYTADTAYLQQQRDYLVPLLKQAGEIPARPLFWHFPIYLQGIVKQAMRGAEKVDLISTSAKQQLEGSEEMVKATANISEVAQDNVGRTDEVRSVIGEQTRSMQQMAASAQELLSLSRELEDITSRFRL